MRVWERYRARVSPSMNKRGQEDERTGATHYVTIPRGSRGIGGQQMP